MRLAGDVGPVRLCGVTRRSFHSWTTTVFCSAFGCVRLSNWGIWLGEQRKTWNNPIQTELITAIAEKSLPQHRQGEVVFLFLDVFRLCLPSFCRWYLGVSWCLGKATPCFRWVFALCIACPATATKWSAMSKPLGRTRRIWTWAIAARGSCDSTRPESRRSGRSGRSGNQWEGSRW